MANPYGNPAGITDPSIPGWQDRIVAAIGRTDAKASRTRIGIRKGRIDSQVDEAFAALMRQAAEDRGLAVAAYIRRAVGAFVASDLGLSFEDVMRLAPAPIPYGQPHTPGTRTADDGTGYGSWEVKG